MPSPPEHEQLESSSRGRFGANIRTSCHPGIGQSRHAHLLYVRSRALCELSADDDSFDEDLAGFGKAGLRFRGFMTD